MHCQLGQRVKRAEDDVVCEPNEQKPARPVAAAQHEYPGKNGEQPDDANPDDVVFKRMLCLKLGGVVDKSDRAGAEE